MYFDIVTFEPCCGFWEPYVERCFVSPVVGEVLSLNKVYFKLKVLLSCSLSIIDNPSDQLWVSPAIWLVLA